MKWLRSIIGYFFAGTLVMGVWGGVITSDFGYIGGILAGLLIIGPMWFMNHSMNLVGHGPNSGFIDLGMGVGIAGIANDTIREGADFLVAAVPTILVVLAGAVVGGLVAGLVEKDIAKDNK